MIKLLRIKKAANVLALMAMTFAHPAHADLADSLESMLGANVQVNSGSAISTAKRGGFYGGSVYVRGRVMDVAIINFTPPSFSAGCGGIDIFGGSFSMINAEQFVALLRAVAQNAAGYAFQLALKNICEQCSTIVSGLQKAVQAMNEFTGNSCQLAQGLVDAGISAFQSADAKAAQADANSKGFGDAFTSFWGGIKEAFSFLNTEDADGDGETDYQEKFVVNVVWKGLKDAGATTWFAGGDKSLMEALMSLTGTVIISGPADDKEGEPSQKIEPIISGSQLTVRDLFLGNASARILECDTAEKCLNPSPSSTKLKGILQILEDDYIGAGPADPDTVLYKLQNGTSAQQDAAQTTMVVKLGDIGSQIIDLVRVSPVGSTAAYHLFDKQKEYIAFEALQLYIGQMLGAVQQSVSSSNEASAYANDWIKNQFESAKANILRELNTLGKNYERPSVTEYVTMYDHLVKTNPFGKK